ncbi:nudix hydrolase 6 [Quercus suber]|uniref:Nudix hydrolase 6 n=1 Tax=Quercus suber TaxID=58331 RepID=A0AAW0JCW1_QUESU
MEIREKNKGKSKGPLDRIVRISQYPQVQNHPLRFMTLDSCVQENSGKFKGTGVWKLPTGVVNEGSFQKIRKHFLHTSIANGLSYIVNWPIKPRC